MMAKETKLRRGTTAENAAFTGAEGELTVDTQTNSLIVHDGSTVGGNAIASAGMTGVTATDSSFQNYPHNVGNVATTSETQYAITPANTQQYMHGAFYYPTTITKLAIHVMTADAGSTDTRIGIYDQHPTTGAPNNLIYGSGHIDVSTTGLKTVTLTTPLEAHGLYWFAMKSDSTTLITRGISRYEVKLSPFGRTSGLATPYLYEEVGAGAGALIATSASFDIKSGNWYRGVGFQ